VHTPIIKYKSNLGFEKFKELSKTQKEEEYDEKKYYSCNFLTSN